MDRKGIKDLLDAHGSSVKSIQEALVHERIPGNWLSSQNVYNLVNGNTIPRDAYVYIFLSEFLQVDVKKILSRYTRKTQVLVREHDLF
jgi:hypothetical protein